MEISELELVNHEGHRQDDDRAREKDVKAGLQVEVISRVLE